MLSSGEHRTFLLFTCQDHCCIKCPLSWLQRGHVQFIMSFHLVTSLWYRLHSFRDSYQTPAHLMHPHIVLTSACLDLLRLCRSTSQVSIFMTYVTDRLIHNENMQATLSVMTVKCWISPLQTHNLGALRGYRNSNFVRCLCFACTNISEYHSVGTCSLSWEARLRE